MSKKNAHTPKKKTQNANKFCSIESPKITSHARQSMSRKLFFRRFIFFKFRLRPDLLEPQSPNEAFTYSDHKFCGILENFNAKFVESSVSIMSLLPALSPPRTQPSRRKKKQPSKCE